MVTLPKDVARKSSDPELIQLLFVEQRAAMEELKALSKELQSLLDELQSARPELRAMCQQLAGDHHPETEVRPLRLTPRDISTAQWKRDAERNVIRSAQLIRESGEIRRRSTAIRAVLRGATPRVFQQVGEYHSAGIDGTNVPHKTNGTNGNAGNDGKKSTNGNSRNNGQKFTNGKSGHDGLSRREFQVLHLIVDGKTSKEIAVELGISFKTAVTHRASIMSKLDVHEIASVVREAIHRGLV